jgi:CheY-like chemotaxis protein
MQAVGTLTGGISHEFNNILQIMAGYTDLIYEKSSEEPLRGNIQEVIKAGRRGKELIKQLLNFSHPKESKFQFLHIIPIVKESIKMMCSTLSPSIEIRKNIDSACETIFGDSDQIHQVLVNLINNASYALNNGQGIIEIGLEQIKLDSDSKTLPSLKAGKHIRLTIQDNGCGMPAEVKERIFEPFFTTKDIGQGTGLGLSVVYGIIQKHKGVINVISEPRKGSTFEIYFPIIEDRSLEQTTKTVKTFRKGEERILFVDDELSIAHLYKEFLNSCGYTVTISNNGMEAFEIFCDSPNNFDMVITDKGMPGMDGIQLTQNLLKVRPDLPVILLTGYGDLINDEKIRKVGFRDILTKPADFIEVSHALRHIFDEIS